MTPAEVRSWAVNGPGQTRAQLMERRTESSQYVANPVVVVDAQGSLAGSYLALVGDTLVTTFKASRLWTDVAFEEEVLVKLKLDLGNIRFPARGGSRLTSLWVNGTDHCSVAVNKAHKPVEQVEQLNEGFSARLQLTPISDQLVITTIALGLVSWLVATLCHHASGSLPW